MGKVHGSLARAGKVRSQCPKVEKQEKPKVPKVFPHSVLILPLLLAPETPAFPWSKCPRIPKTTMEENPRYYQIQHLFDEGQSSNPSPDHRLCISPTTASSKTSENSRDICKDAQRRVQGPGGLTVEYPGILCTVSMDFQRGMDDASAYQRSPGPLSNIPPLKESGDS
ncbi:hypothetical protein F4824DRAFT_496604 [Ustulina deusta]|nr:hypothetical protein F4824DRAFT_496604 [Ustulina deusta]